MKRTLLFAALSAASVFTVQVASAATFSYHGVLQDAGKPAQGKYDIELTLYSSQNGGSVVGGPMTLYAVPVQDGSFSTDADFGPLSNAMAQAFVAVKVRPAGAGSFTALAERSSVVETNASCPGSWTLNGNAGNPAGSYLGTADSQPLIVKVNGIQAASFTPGQGVALGQDGLGPATASGSHSFASGVYVTASGLDSFAAGFQANAGDGSFMWGGGSSSGGAVTATTAPNQFVIRAAGGVAINGTPKNGATELSIYPPPGQLNYSNIFMGQTGTNAGMLVSAGDATATNNDAAFYMDQYDGTHQSRKLVVNTAGLIINDPTAIPAGAGAALSVVHSGTDTEARINMFSTASDHSYFQLDSSASREFDIYQFVPGHPAVNVLAISADGGLVVSGDAAKPGGGSWSVSSDRRIKQDIAPIHDALDTVMKLRPVNFHYTPEYRAMEGGLPDKSYDGFIAQEYAEVFPSDVVSTNKHVPGAAKTDPTILALDPNSAVITTVAAVQELAVDNATLRKEVEALTRRLGKLEAAKGN